jgi:NAD(P)-dependent dehydrogenase (short-subunit alcohol dehydrogenase family)
MASREDLEETAALCRRDGSPGVETRVADVSKPGLREEIAAAVGGRRVAAAVAAAGAIAGGEAWETAEGTWELMIGVNLHGTRRLAEATVPSMLAAGTGRFVAVSSAAALRAMPRLAAYSAAKAAVVAFVRALAADLAGSGVTANAVCPGSTRGAMLAVSARIYGLAGEDEFAGQHLLRRLLDPDEVAEVVAWLCGPESSALTGAVIAADGGLSA